MLSLQHIPNIIAGINTMGPRIYVSDVQESVLFLRYKQYENQLVIFADDVSQRFCTAVCLLDYNTVAVADKFGSVTLVRSTYGTLLTFWRVFTGLRLALDENLVKFNKAVMIGDKILKGLAIKNVQRFFDLGVKSLILMSIFIDNMFVGTVLSKGDRSDH